jgi:hypothetical protein
VQRGSLFKAAVGRVAQIPHHLVTQDWLRIHLYYVCVCDNHKGCKYSIIWRLFMRDCKHHLLRLIWGFWVTASMLMSFYEK